MILWEHPANSWYRVCMWKLSWNSTYQMEYVSTVTITHTIHVWVYLPTFGWFFMVNLSKYTSPMDPMGNIPENPVNTCEQ